MIECCLCKHPISKKKECDRCICGAIFCRYNCGISSTCLTQYDRKDDLFGACVRCNHQYIDEFTTFYEVVDGKCHFADWSRDSYPDMFEYIMNVLCDDRLVRFTLKRIKTNAPQTD